MIRIIAIVPVAALLVIAGLLGYCQFRTTQFNTAFAKVAIGDTEHDVVMKMGRPHRVVEGCGYYYKRPIVGCAREYVYFPPWTIAGEAWLISFNPDGSATSKAHFLSP